MSKLPEVGDNYTVDEVEYPNCGDCTKCKRQYTSCINRVWVQYNGKVSNFTYWADNWIDMHVLGNDGVKRTVMMSAPSGDCC